MNLVIPMSKAHENMIRSDKRDAVIAEKFFFRFKLQMLIVVNISFTSGFMEMTM